uniref:type 1 glutamine amidotransferase n=1 Tax=uncultured Draconibacterium sp. TaxID=1573823 RepID=UPI003216BA31
MSKIVIVNNAEPGITEFAKPFEQIISEAGSRFVCINYSDCLNFNFEEVDGAILTGSPQGDDIVEHHLPYFLWVREFEKPVFGICAGHHITGYLYGSALLRSKEPESGDFNVEIIKPNPLFNGISKSFVAKQMHNDSITLPSGFELLATSKTCVNQLMKHNQKPIYTCQFHPEFYNHKLIRNFLQLC